MTSHCDSNPAQYERNRRFGHLVHALGRAAGGAKLPSVGLCLNASKAVSSLVKGGNDISRSLVSRKAQNNVTLLGGRSSDRSSHEPDDLGTWRGVVLGRAVTTLRSVETQPSAWEFVLSVRRDPTRALERDYASPEADRATELRQSEKATRGSGTWPLRRPTAQRARESNTRLGDFATPPADSSESSRKQHEARGLCHSAGRQLRELEKATRGSGTLPLRRPTAQRARESNTRLGDFATPPADSSESSRKQHEARGLCHSAGRQLRELEKATRGSGTLPLRRPTAQRARESNTRLGDFATPPADSSESSRKQHEARGLCHSAGRQLRELEKATRGSGTLPLRRPTAQRARESNTRLGDFATPPADSSESSRKQHEARDFATPPADSSESSRKQHEARGLCHSAGRQLRELEQATRGSGTLPLRRPTAQRARESNTRLGDFATPPADSSESSKKQHEARGLCHSAGRQLRELEKATRGSGTLPLRRPTAQRARESNTRLGDFATPPADSSESSRKQHEARGLCHSVGLQFRELEKATRGSGTLPLRRPTA
ncbi:hypothetical protein PUN28_020438 [Cardiocondyla obscurior]|uniref:Uncharacterized protein n=1 Tax=Cardiocondyla obscurior TaxID=286306 RepID=A0AAW2E9N3_9HYME